MGIVQQSFQRLHYPVEIILLCLRWYLAYGLSLRNLEEMMLERGIGVDHSTIHRWVLRLSPLLVKVSKKHSEPPRVSRRPNFLREYPNEKYLLT